MNVRTLLALPLLALVPLALVPGAAADPVYSYEDCLEVDVCYWEEQQDYGDETCVGMSAGTVRLFSWCEGEEGYAGPDCFGVGGRRGVCEPEPIQEHTPPVNPFSEAFRLRHCAPDLSCPLPDPL